MKFILATILAAPAVAFTLSRPKTSRLVARSSSSAPTTALITSLTSTISSTSAPPTTTTTTNSLDNHLDFEELSAPEASDKFNWFKAWYPVVPICILDEEQPHKFELLGMDIVVWKDAAVEGVTEFGPKPKKGKRLDGQWRAFMDECPHRKVPLSEGRVEADGSLLCSYHGWRFDGSGDLIDVPQIDSDDLSRVKSNPKSKCNSFPTQIIDGVLWVWPETGSDAIIESALTEAKNYQLPEGVYKDDVWFGPWNYRQLPYSADYFIENVVDPAHVSVSHHNIVGSRYGDLTQDYMKSVSKVTKDGFKFLTMPKMVAATGANTTYSAPAHVAIETGADGAMQTLELYASPSRPGFCNHVGRMVIVKDKNGKTPALLRQFTLPMPMWLNHVIASLFLNQDALFLHHQERYLSKTGDYTSVKHEANFAADHYTKAVLPVQTDLGVVNYRNWLRVFAGGRVPYKHDFTMPEANRDAVFDVWNAHTKYCNVCLTALKNLKRARSVAFFVAACLTILRPASKSFSLVGALASAGIGLGLSKLIGLFYRYEFNHAHND